MSGMIFGGGITIGGGISLVPEGSSGGGEGGGGGGATPNSIVVGQVNSYYNFYGALLTTGNIYMNPGVGDFGTVTSDYIYALYYTTDNNYNFQTVILMNGGTYTGFSVSNGVIDSDQLTYPRVFTINGTDYTFTLANGGQYIMSGDPISLETKVGDTVTIVYDINKQPTISPNTMIVASYDQMGTTYYGASKEGYMFGTLASAYIKELRGDGTTITIILSTGSYTGFDVASSGAIDDDVSGSTRVFTIGGTDITFTAGGSPSNLSYLVFGDPVSLSTKVGQTVTLVYDPEAQPGPPPAFFDGDAYAFTTDFSNSAISIGGSPFSGFYVMISQNDWTTTAGYTAIRALTTGGRFKINTDLQAGGTGDSIATLTSGWTSQGPFWRADVTLSVNVSTGSTINSVTLEGIAPTASGTMTIGFDGSNSYGYVLGVTGTSTIDPDMIFSISYFTMSNDTSIQFGSGTYGDVVVSNSPATIDGETTVTVTVDGVTQTSTLMQGGTGPMVMISGDPFSLQSKVGNTVDVTVVAGAGGGSATTYTSSGNWNYSNWQSSGGWHITLGLSSNPDSAMLTKLNALTSGSSITLSDGINTETVTVSYTNGQPWSSYNTVEIYTNTGSTTGSYASIASITL